MPQKKAWKTDCNSEFKEATTTPLVEHFFGEFFDCLNIVEDGKRNRKPAQKSRKDKLTAEVTINGKVKKNSGEKKVRKLRWSTCKSLVNKDNLAEEFLETSTPHFLNGHFKSKRTSNVSAKRMCPVTNSPTSNPSMISPSKRLKDRRRSQKHQVNVEPEACHDDSKIDEDLENKQEQSESLRRSQRKSILKKSQHSTDHSMTGEDLEEQVVLSNEVENDIGKQVASYRPSIIKSENIRRSMRRSVRFANLDSTQASEDELSGKLKKSIESSDKSADSDSTIRGSVDSIEVNVEPLPSSRPQRKARQRRFSVIQNDEENKSSADSNDDANVLPEKLSGKSNKSAESSKRSVGSNYTMSGVGNSFDVKIQPLSSNTYHRKSRKRGSGVRNNIVTDETPNEKSSAELDEEAEIPPKKVRKSREGKSITRNNESRNPTTISGNVTVGDFVSVIHGREKRVGLVRKIESDKYHIHRFISSSDTVLGDVGNPHEIFLTDECGDVERTEIKAVIDVTRLSPMALYEEENTEFKEWEIKSKGKTNLLFYQKSYESKYGRFRDLPEYEEKPGVCPNCELKEKMLIREIPTPIGPVKFDEKAGKYMIDGVLWRDEEFRPGTSVFLTPGTLGLPQRVILNDSSKDDYDESEFPEKYRKTNSRDDDAEQIEPFDVGLICEIFSDNQSVTNSKVVRARVRKYYRPHNSYLTMREANLQDLNLLYWSDEEQFVTFEKIEGKCYVAFEKTLEMDVAEWSAKGPYRFYFSEKYDCTQNNLIELSEQDTKMAIVGHDTPTEWPTIDAPLAMMDLFSGCGGLSEGLRQSGVAECRWAIEINETVATAFQKNNKRAKIYVNSCEDQLKIFKKGNSRNRSESYPQRGDVDLLCGGPPCTGISRMDRFRDGDYSSFENSLIGSYLSYCDYFRPRFLILENVRDFINTSKGMVFKLSLGKLIKMGYQVTFGVLQCGRYGVPQNRRRAVILAAAPGENLPMFPEPTHAFSNKYLDMKVDEKKIVMDQQWTSAPYRSLTVGDAISDLPSIENDDYKEKMFYRNEPFTHYQQLMRGSNSRGDDVLRDHVCKSMSLLNCVRISYIPALGDWRDLPNIEVELPNGTWANKLMYTHRDWKNGESSNGEFRGVCSCASKKNATCKKDSKQTDTLIPWCLPHTGNRHGNWNGLFGRLGWNGYFRTVVSNPEPMGKQGKVVHPNQNRVVSIRECARSQGFPDDFKFNGTVLEKYSQIGNAFTPPLAKAIGCEIKKCVAEKSNQKL